MKFIKAFFEILEALLASDKKKHAGKKFGGTVAKKSFKKLRKAW